MTLAYLVWWFVCLLVCSSDTQCLVPAGCWELCRVWDPERRGVGCLPSWSFQFIITKQLHFMVINTIAGFWKLEEMRVLVFQVLVRQLPPWGWRGSRWVRAAEIETQPFCSAAGVALSSRLWLLFGIQNHFGFSSQVCPQLSFLLKAD